MKTYSQNEIDAFNKDLLNRELFRRTQLSDAQDLALNTIIDRITNEPDTYSNKELTELYKIMQDATNKSTLAIEGNLAPVIQINQLNVGAEDRTLNRESRERISDVISKILIANDASYTDDMDIIEDEQ